MPVLDLRRREYIAHVKCQCCPGYSAPYPHGRRTDVSYPRGSMVRVLETEVSACGTYLSARTQHDTWINLWTLYNLRGDPVGVDFRLLTYVSRRGNMP